MLKIKLSLTKIVASVVGLFLLYVPGGILFFNATPKDKRVTWPIKISYKVTDPEFKRVSGIIGEYL